MKLYNTMTGKKEAFVPIVPGEVRMYACGPTVYNYFHIGNARPFITYDLLRRYLEYKGYKVRFVQNFTDVDDKIINRANEEGVSPFELSERYIAEYFKDAEGLGIKRADVHPKATETIGQMLEMISVLVDKGYAYAVEGDVYFRARKFGGYGELAHQQLDDLEAGARIEVGEKKEEPLDFALWKAAKEGEPSWESPWGRGRPGWHIECSAMIKKFLGDTIDIHGGGQDLAFPHHQNEIAQSEAANGVKFVNYWLHNGYINVDNRKMSKSLGNFFTVRDAAERYGYETIRFFMLSAHYRNPINYSLETMEQAKAGLSRLYTCLDNLNFALANAPDGLSDISGLSSYKERFVESMDDDLNTAGAISVIFDLAREINTKIGENAPKSWLLEAKRVYLELCDLLGILTGRETSNDADSELRELIEKRQTARKAKDFKTADAIRDKLKEMGVTLEDTPQGVRALIEKDGIQRVVIV